MKKSSKKRAGIRGMFLCLAVILTCLAAVFASASEADRMPALTEGQNGSLTVAMNYRDPWIEDEAEAVKPLGNVPVKLVRVADVAVNGGSADYTLLEAFASSEVVFAGMTTSESIAAAQTLMGLVPEGSETTLATDENGNVSFGDLAPGMYLLYQADGANEEYSVDPIGATLIPVPLPVVSEEGNHWQYEVESQPKTEPVMVHRNGRIEVTKYLYDKEHNITFYPPVDQELVFYVGLFLDENCTQMAPNTQELPLVIKNNDHASVVFENLETDKTYYVAETDGQGTVISSITVDDLKYTAEYPEGQSVTITRQQPEGTLTYRNTIDGDLPDGYYYTGILEVIKKTTRNRVPFPTTRTFYAGLFRDKTLKDLVEVLELKLENSSEVSVQMTVDFGHDADAQIVYYVAETDQDGKPLNANAQEFTITMNPADGKLPVGPKLEISNVTIVNDFTVSPTPSPSPVVTPSVSITPSPTPGEDNPPGGGNPPSGGGSPGGNGPKTGDDTPIVMYVILLAAAAVGVLAAGWNIRKKRR